MKQRAFTLIELLVVIAIIGILATVVLTSLGSARERARDARRQSDIRTIQQALEVYYLENGEYPQTMWNGVAPNSYWANSGNSTSWQALETEMGVDLPEDPVNDVPQVGADWPAGGNQAFNYAYTGRGYGCPTGSMYRLVYRLEEGNTPPSESPGVVRCDGPILKYGNGAITVGVSPAG